jgi:hypothetical protein
MTWTILKPTKPGWYWYRKNEEQSQVLMHVQGIGEPTTAYGLKDDGNRSSICLVNGPAIGASGATINWTNERPANCQNCCNAPNFVIEYLVPSALSLGEGQQRVLLPASIEACKLQEMLGRPMTSPENSRRIDRR